MTTQTIYVTDTVRLRGTTMTMVVEAIDCGVVFCLWYDVLLQLQRFGFSIDMLERTHHDEQLPQGRTVTDDDGLDDGW